VVLHVHIHVPWSASADWGACPRVVADRSAQEGKRGLGCGRTGFSEGDGTSSDNLGGLGMVVLFLSTGIRERIYDQYFLGLVWTYGRTIPRHKQNAVLRR